MMRKELFSEQPWKGFVRIKIAQPRVWMFKHVWLWNQAHPDDLYVKKRDCIYFLDMDKTNCSLDNIIKIPRAVVPAINVGRYGKLEKGKPEKNRLIIQMAINEKLLFDRGEELGLTVKRGRRCRCFIEEERERDRKKYWKKKKKKK